MAAGARIWETLHALGDRFQVKALKQGMSGFQTMAFSTLTVLRRGMERGGHLDERLCL
jgi:hypothetical protein